MFDAIDILKHWTSNNQINKEVLHFCEFNGDSMALHGEWHTFKNTRFALESPLNEQKCERSLKQQ